MKQKQIWIGVIVILLIILAGWYISSKPKQVVAPVSLPNATSTVDTRVEADSSSPLDVRNAAYAIDGSAVTLVGGASQKTVSNSSSTIKTAVLEGPAFADLNGDNVKDAVVILRQETGGSGVFYYVSALLTNGNSSTGVATNAILLGDRIHINSISIDQGIISVTILDRKDGEPFSATPTAEKTLRFTLSGGTLSQVL